MILTIDYMSWDDTTSRDTTLHYMTKIHNIILAFALVYIHETTLHDMIFHDITCHDTK